MAYLEDIEIVKLIVLVWSNKFFRISTLPKYGTNETVVHGLVV